MLDHNLYKTCSLKPVTIAAYHHKIRGSNKLKKLLENSEFKELAWKLHSEYVLMEVLETHFSGNFSHTKNQRQ